MSEIKIKPFEDKGKEFVAKIKRGNKTIGTLVHRPNLGVRICWVTRLPDQIDLVHDAWGVESELLTVLAMHKATHVGIKVEITGDQYLARFEKFRQSGKMALVKESRFKSVGVVFLARHHFAFVPGEEQTAVDRMRIAKKRLPRKAA